jgi:KDO2-lipid IV(A) lauroyltransferase
VTSEPLRAAKNWGIWALVTALLAATRPLSARALRVLGRAIGASAYVMLGGARRQSHENLARAFPALPPAARARLVRENFLALGENLGDAVAMLGGPARPSARAPLAIDATSARVLDEALVEGRGVLLASAHLGPWERVAASLVFHGVPLTAIVRAPYDPRLASIFARLRAAHGIRVVERGAPGAAARIVRTLKEGRVLGVPMDLASRVPSVPARFFGALAPTPIGPARIALRTGAAVVVATSAPRPTRHGAAPGDLVIQITRIRTDDLAPGGDGPSQGRAHELTQRINDELARRIARLPAQWVWMHPRWPAPVA